MIDLRYVKKLVEMLDASTLDAIEISTEKGAKIRVSKAATPFAGLASAVPQPAVTIAAPELRPSPAAGVPVQAVPAPAAAPAAAASTHTEVKSPMVGTFYASPEPGAKPFVAVGTRVAKGQVLCIIEAMKLMNEIDSEYDGEITSIYIENGQPVQYGERLFAIKPTK